MMSRFPSESNSPVRVAALTCGTEALCRREIGLCDSATIFCRTPHANEQRTFPSQFHTAPAEKLAGRLLAMAPPNFQNGGRVYFTSGGSEATETAIKLARQFFLESKQPSRYRIVSRKQSYHGSTLGAMTVSGNVGRRAPYAPMIPEWGHVAACFC